jgi:O-antigen/teichoic acid export membrane protein
MTLSSMDDTLLESDAAPPTEAPDPSAATGAAGALVSRALGALVGRAGLLIVSFGFAVMVARVLDPAGRGNFALLQATNGLTVVLANFAIGGAVVYHVGKGRISHGRALGAASTLAVVSGGMAALILIPIALAFRSRLFPDLAPALVMGAVLLAAPLLLREYVGGTLIGQGRPQRYLLSHAAQPIGATAALIAIVVAGSGTLAAVVWGWAIGILLSGLTAVAMSASLVPGRPQVLPEDLRTLGRFGVRTYPALLARFLNLRLDQFLVRFLATSAVLGQYAVAVNVGELLIQVPVVLLWALSGSISSADRDRSADLVVQFCRWSLIILGAAAVAVAVLTPVGLPLAFGSEYRGAVGSVLLLLPGMICYAPATIIAEYFIVQRGRPGKAAVIAGASIVASLTLNFPLTPALGAAGASIASSVSYGVMLLVAVSLFTSDTGRRTGELLRVSRSDLSDSVRVLRGLVRPIHPVR